MLGTYDKLDILFFTIGYIFIVLISYFIHKRKSSDEKKVKSKKIEIIEDIKYICIFIILGVLPSLL